MTAVAGKTTPFRFSSLIDVIWFYQTGKVRQPLQGDGLSYFYLILRTSTSNFLYRELPGPPWRIVSMPKTVGVRPLFSTSWLPNQRMSQSAKSLVNGGGCRLFIYYKSYIGALRPQPRQHGRVKRQWCQMTYTKFDTYSPLQQRPNDKKFKHENFWV